MGDPPSDHPNRIPPLGCPCPCLWRMAWPHGSRQTLDARASAMESSCNAIHGTEIGICLMTSCPLGPYNIDDQGDTVILLLYLLLTFNLFDIGKGNKFIEKVQNLTQQENGRKRSMEEGKFSGFSGQPITYWLVRYVNVKQAKTYSLAKFCQKWGIQFGEVKFDKFSH